MSSLPPVWGTGKRVSEVNPDQKPLTTAGPVGPWTQPVVLFLVSKHIFGIAILSY